MQARPSGSGDPSDLTLVSADGTRLTCTRESLCPASGLLLHQQSDGTLHTLLFTRADEDGATLALLLQFLEHVTVDCGPASAHLYVRVIALLQRHNCPRVIGHLTLALERALRQGHLPRALAFCLGAVADDGALCAAALACDEPPNAPHAYGLLDLDALPLEVVQAVPPVYFWLLNRAFRRRINNKTSWAELATWFEREASRVKVNVSGSHAEILRDNEACAYVTDDMRRSLELALSSKGSSPKNGTGV
ncbi:hypothetical protein A1Q1_02945 [Trichosporon asahii var. asahii CBS 2479]|uniref:BTB domain-containing protein n=1 Tax=Trichosporon asahii var. asahii (strain ATCC 90039 / CBS 2479 / JCM 2466 / KCTC 7840 / NBRC 103889/ NCYC 2677 / UAMH 7654) TaxID=1186058 RepID=J6EU00_TRIAS|nr:hypothetical protein A1Q1_02945 [Trichosporon asahii var. asahii CBS 2479]EJT48029.1 hypothetical protein A1Q1_02945 [Trichosporon asahii var. asahii CBS 2479]